MTVGPVRSRPATQQSSATQDALQGGSHGAPVTALQHALTAAGFSPGAADGVFGSKTQDAVRAFQQAHGLNVDGVVGPNTRAALAAAPHATAPTQSAEAPTRTRADAATVTGSRQRAAHADQTARARVDPQAQVQPSTAAPTGATPTRDITNHLDPAHNPRYLRHGGNTYCNVFTQDVMRARGVRDFPQMTANDTNAWLHRQGAAHGWRQVSGEEAQAFVNGGGVGLVNRVNPRGHGHIAPIIEGTTANGSPTISNAGSRNFNVGHASDSPAFRRSGTEYWIRDSH